MSRPTSASKFHKSKILHDKYLLGDEIGKGAHGRVYKGVDLENGDFVAIKQVSLENILSEDWNTIMTEIDLLKNLNHKNIVKYLSSFKTKSHLYIILEYVENGSLASNIKPNKFGAFPESLAAVYIAQVLEGLVYLHEQGVIHRDIKGANILTTKEGLVKLADFGVATRLEKADFKTQSVVGTPYWMAPEVIEMSGVSMASDIWSVGCTVIELLTCVPPYYDLQPMPALFRIVQDDRPPLPEHLSPQVADFLCHCFQKDAKLRPDAKSLLKHPWLRIVRRQSPSPVKSPSGPLAISEIPEETSVVVERVYIDDDEREDMPFVDDVTIALHRDPFDSFSDDDESRFPRSPSMSYPASEEERRSMEMHHPIRISRKGLARQLRRTSGSHSQERFPLLTGDSSYSPDRQPPPLPYSRGEAANGERRQAPGGSSSGLMTPPRGVSTGARGDGTLGGLSGIRERERGPGVASTSASASAADSAYGVQNAGEESHRGRGLGGARVVEDYDPRWADTDARHHVGEDSSHMNFHPRGIRYDEGISGGVDMRQVSLRAHDDRSGDDVEDGFSGGAADHPGMGSFMPPRGLPPRGARERMLVSSSPQGPPAVQGPMAKLKGRLSGKRDSPVRPPRRRTRSSDYDSADDDEMDGGRREVVMKQAVEVARLMSMLTPEQSEDNLANLCDRLLSIFREFPDNRVQLVSQLGVTPVMDMLDVNSNDRVLEKILMVLNQVIRDNIEFQEHLCVVGLIPAVLHFADPEKYRRDVRTQAAYFVNQMCDGSPLTLQMFIACRGLPMLVRFLERDYLVHREMVHVAIEGVWRVFELNGPTPKQDICRFFTKAGIFDRLIITLQQLNDAFQKVTREEANGHSIGAHSGPLGYGNGTGRTLPALSLSTSSPAFPFSSHSHSQPVSPHGAMHSGPLGPIPAAAPPPPSVSLVSRSLSWTRRGSNGSAAADADSGRQYEEEHVGNGRRKSGGLFSSLINLSQNNSSTANEKASLTHSEPPSSSYQYSLSTGSTYSENTGISGQSPAYGGSRNGAATANGHYSGGGWSSSIAAGGPNSGQHSRLNLSPPAEVSYSYANKVADLLLVFSQADSSVKQQMASHIHLHRLFKLLDSLEPALLVKVLRCMRELSTDENSNTIEALQRADVIKVVVPFLEQRDGDLVPHIHLQVLSVLNNVCKHNKQRQEQAAVAGIIPHLQYMINTDSTLRPIAVALLCEMAHASRRTREELRKHQVLDTYLGLLKDSNWAVMALDSIAVWLAFDHEQRKVEQALLKKESLQKLVDFFGSCSGPAFVQILEPFYKIITKSSRLNTALAVSGLMPILVARLDNENPIARLTLLKIIFAVYEHHPRPKQLIVEHDLVKKLQRMVEDKRGDEAILLKNMASALLKGLHINTVL